MTERIRYAGLDVSKDTIAVAVAEPDGSVATYGTIANDPGAVRRLVERLSGDAVLSTAYEAGPTGYALHRQLVSLGVRSQVVAPTLIPRQPGNRVKTDRRDAEQLVRLLRRGDLVAVWVPDQAHEALRDLAGRVTTPAPMPCAPSTGLASSCSDEALCARCTWGRPGR